MGCRIELSENKYFGGFRVIADYRKQYDPPVIRLMRVKSNSPEYIVRAEKLIETILEKSPYPAEKIASVIISKRALGKTSSLSVSCNLPS